MVSASWRLIWINVKNDLTCSADFFGMERAFKYAKYIFVMSGGKIKPRIVKVRNHG